MPISFLEVPPGIRMDAKRKLVREIQEALDEAYRIPDTRIFIHEWPHENVCQDGLLGAETAKPICFLEVPPDIQLVAKRTMVKRISDALTEAYHLTDVLIFMREYPLDRVSQDGGLQSENPMILEAMAQAAGHAA
jgi:phenylpyruvate tautomerase PptA (4-oxalocrotonate tautomerase family)